MQQEIQCTLRCEQHTEQQVIAIHFGEKQMFKCRFICLKCILSLQIKPEYIMSIQDFMDDNPLGKIDQIDGQIINLDDWCQSIENAVIQLEAVCQNYFKEVRNYLQIFKSQFQQLGQDFNKEIKLEEFKKQFLFINQMDTYQGQQEYIELKETLNEIIQKIKIQSIDFNHKKVVNCCQFYKNFNDKLIELKVGIDEYKSKIYKQFDQQILLKELVEFPEIHKQISNGKNITYDLIYQGTRDGLQAGAYWQKCNLQSNLLTILTSKNGNIFGSFSPCQLNKDLSSYVQDVTLKSFLFQYNKKEIYPLKRKDYAIYCHSGHGPCYGQRCDVVVNGDFQAGHSNHLSENYDTSKYVIQDQSTHLFFDKTPQLVECVVYKIKQE
ncbi:hypothetical protein pb186bvf_007468 [Paramecium bursaria]